MATRRAFLGLLGGGVVLAAGAGTLWASTRDPAKARRAWDMAGRRETDPCRKALSYAVLAPNPHNRQPWIADLSVKNEVVLYCDGDRRLPHTDPFDRQITIGLGCFLELFALAAADDGHEVQIALFPEGEPQPRLDGRPVARIRLLENAGRARDPLFAQVLARRSNKEVYDLARPVETGSLATIAASAHASAIAHTNDPDRVAALRTLAWDANVTEITTPHTLKESIDLIRIGRAEIEAAPDGIDLSGAMMEALALTGMISRDALLDQTSTAFRQQLPILKAPFETAMAFLWQTTSGNRRTDQIAAGRDYIRLNLAATAAGVSMQPLSQALQEFPEMRPHFRAMRQALGVGEGETLQMLVRLGYGPAIKGAPRWPYETRIRSA